MRKPLFSFLAYCSLALAVSAARGADFYDKTVQVIRGPDGRPCTFFSLDGVNPSDPSTPSSPWFVLRQASPGYKENLALLMSAKLTGRVVRVSTTGSIVPECGQVEAYVVMLP